MCSFSERGGDDRLGKNIVLSILIILQVEQQHASRNLLGSKSVKP